MAVGPGPRTRRSTSLGVGVDRGPGRRHRHRHRHRPRRAVPCPARSRVWTATGPGTWSSSLPSGFDQPSLPTTTIPQLPPSAALSLVTTVGSRVVMMSEDPALDRFYTLETGLGY